MTRPWTEISPDAAAKLSLEDLKQVDRPTNELGETCPWPWEPQQLGGAPMGQFHCSYCGGMQIAGLPHVDWRDMPADTTTTEGTQ
jgi:hypothetical protein